LFGVTTILAPVAALAGMYYRRQPPEAQTDLAIAWSVMAALLAAGVCMRWRDAFGGTASLGAVKFMAWSAPKPRSWMRASAVHVFMLGASVAFAAMWSAQIAESAARGHGRSLGVIIAQAAQPGLCLSGILFLYLRTPIFLCEDGMRFARGLAPWRFIRQAEWTTPSQRVLKFRRLDGDVYMSVTERDRDAIEAFVREKTTFNDAEAPTERRPVASQLAPGQ
jgi:hypothetical protein